MKISYKRFLTELSSLQQKFIINDNGTIRLKKDNTECPFLAVASDILLDDGSFQVLLNKKCINYEIWDAADNREISNKKIRKDLLKACHIKEKQ